MSSREGSPASADATTAGSQGLFPGLKRGVSQINDHGLPRDSFGVTFLRPPRSGELGRIDEDGRPDFFNPLFCSFIYGTDGCSGKWTGGDSCGRLFPRELVPVQEGSSQHRRVPRSILEAPSERCHKFKLEGGLPAKNGWDNPSSGGQLFFLGRLLNTAY